MLDLFRGGSAIALSLAVCTGAAAEYPEKPIRLIVGFAPGGATDIVARLVSPEAAARLGQPVVVENRPGANGNIANDTTAAAAPDGYTLLLTNPGSQIYNPLIYKSIKVDPQKAFAPVTQLTESPLLVVVPTSSSINTFPELLAQAKQAPATVSFGSTGNGSTSHLVGAMLERATGTKMVHVPYKGSGQSMTDLLAGRLDFMADSRSPTMPYLRDKRLRALAVTGGRRVADLPDVPTIAEAGVAGFNVTTWLGLVVPVGTPPDVIDKLNAAFAGAVQTPKISAQLEQLGTSPLGTSEQAFATMLGREQQVAETLVRELNLSVD